MNSGSQQRPVTELYPSLDHDDDNTEVMTRPMDPPGSFAITRFFPHGERRQVRLNAPFVIGRSKTADFQLEDPRMSRTHAVISKVEGAWAVRDCGSRNGTFLDGRRVHGEFVPIDHNETLRVGASLFAIGPLRRSPSILGEDVLIGRSLFDVRAGLASLADNDGHVLICGPSGSGKTTAATALNSHQARLAMEIVDCSRLTIETVSALFGQRSQEPTLLVLSGIENLTTGVQRRLLRLLRQPTPAPFARIVSTTTLEDGRPPLRDSLFSSLRRILAPIVIELPSLESRKADIAALASFLLERVGLGRRIDADAMEALALHHWSGNVRELDCLLLRAAFATRHRIMLDDLHASISRRFRRRRTQTASSVVTSAANYARAQSATG